MTTAQTYLFAQYILSSELIDLFILNKMKMGNMLPETWKVKDMSFKRRKNNPLWEAYVFIDSDDTDKSASFNEFIEYAIVLIGDGTFTYQGLANLIIVTHSIGFVGDEEVLNAENRIIALIAGSDYIKICKGLIVQYNTYFTIEDHKPNVEKSTDSYDSIFFKLQYAELFDSPIRVLNRLLKWRQKELPVLELISSINPEPRAAIFELQFPMQCSENEMMDFLKTHPDEAPFWAVYLQISPHKSLSFLGKKILDYFIRQKWEDIGWYLFRKIYNYKGYRMVDETVKVDLKSHLDSFLRPQFFESESFNEIFKKIKFHPDLLTIGAWLYETRETNALIEINSSSVTGFCQVLSAHLVEVKSDLVRYVQKTNEPYQAWFSDPYDVKAQTVSDYLIRSVMYADAGNWDVIKKSLVNLCYEIKILYYGSYSPVNIAKTFTNHLLSLVLTFPNIEVKYYSKISRMRELYEIISTIILPQWINLVEREKMIWNPDNYQFTFSDAELAYILQRLREVPEIYKDAVSSINNSIQKYATVTWPITSS